MIRLLDIVFLRGSGEWELSRKTNLIPTSGAQGVSFGLSASVALGQN